MNSGKETGTRPQSREMLGGLGRSNQLFKLNSPGHAANSEHRSLRGDILPQGPQISMLSSGKESYRPIDTRKETQGLGVVDLFAAEPRAAGGYRHKIPANGKFTEMFAAKQNSRSRLSSNEMIEVVGAEGPPKAKQVDKHQTKLFLGSKQSSMQLASTNFSAQSIKPQGANLDKLAGTISVGSLGMMPINPSTSRTNPEGDKHPSPSKQLRNGLLEQTLTIQIISSWHPTSLSTGLHSLEIRDRADNLISINPDCMSCTNCGLVALKELPNLVKSSRTQSAGSDWRCMIGSSHPEITLNLRTAPQIGKLRIWYAFLILSNLLRRETSIESAQYSGVRKIAVFLNAREIFAGELKKPNSGRSEGAFPQETSLKDLLTTEIDVVSSNSNSGSPTMLKNEALKSNGTASGSLRPKALTRFVGGTSSGHLGAASTIVKVVGRNTVTSINSEDNDSKRDTLGKQSIGGMAPSVESKEDMIFHGRSLSKQSKSSFDSKKHHPKVANSSAKLMFDPTVSRQIPTSTNLLPGVPLPSKVGYEDKFAPARHRESSEGVRKDPVRLMSGFGAVQAARSNRELTTKKKQAALERNATKLLELAAKHPSLQLPNRPSGTQLVLTFYTNWGDPEHLGLNGIEFFNQKGYKIDFPSPELSISVLNAEKSGVHYSPEYLKRIIRPDLWRPATDQLFLSKLEDGNPLQIKINFTQMTGLSLIRIWNYDRSKTHSARGVRHMSMELDKTLIFLGEIRRSSGDRNSFLVDAEYISFLPEGYKSASRGFDEDWVNKVTAEDYNPPNSDYNETYRTTDITSFLRANSLSREPSESIRGTVSSTSGSPRARGSVQADGRSSHALGWNALDLLERRIKHRNTASGYEFSLVPTLAGDETLSPTGKTLATDCLEFTFLEAWKGAPVFALKAIELFGTLDSNPDESNNKIKVGKENVESDYENVQGQVIFLFSGDPNRKMDEYIWKAKVNPHAKLRIRLSKKAILKSIRIHNYSSSNVGIQGVKLYKLKVGNQPWTIRTANFIPPELGSLYFQTISLEQLPPSSPPKRLQDCKSSGACLLEPSGYVVPSSTLRCQMLRLRLLSTAADKHHVGLNGVEVLDSVGRPLLYPAAVSFKVFAEPTMASSGAIIEDKRVPQNLVNGVTEGDDKHQFFMAPFVNPRKWGTLKMVAGAGGEHKAVAPEFNQIFILFDEPQEVTGLILYHYSANPARSVSEIEVFVNEHIVFAGQLDPSSQSANIPLCQEAAYVTSSAGCKNNPITPPIYVNEGTRDGGNSGPTFFQPKPIPEQHPVLERQFSFE